MQVTAVPCDRVLHTGLRMVKATIAPKNAPQPERKAVSRGAVVLSEADHAAIMEELRGRQGGDSASPAVPLTRSTASLIS